LNILVSNIILDAPIIFSAFIFLINGWKKGVVRPFMNFVGGLIAFAVSGFVAFYISIFVHNNFFRPVMIKKFSELLLKPDIASFPKYLLAILNLLGVNSLKISNLLGKFNAGEILFNMISPYILNITRLLLGSFLFGILMFVCKKISKSSCSAFSAPVLAQFNSALGACFGFLKGLFIIWGIILFLKILLIYWSNPPKIFSPSVIKSTSVFVKFYDFNPIDGINIGDNFFAKMPFVKNTNISKCLL